MDRSEHGSERDDQRDGEGFIHDDGSKGKDEVTLSRTPAGYV
jgi:hypothetical protein